MDEFVANFDLDRQEFEADFELEQPVEFDAVFEINPAGASWGGITGTLANQTDLKNELDTLSGQIDSNHQAITEINTTIQGYGDIVTYNASDFATSAQGLLADTALQPNDNISELVNDVGYITSASIPIVNDGKLALQVNSVDVGEFTANQSSTTTVNITVPTQASDINAVPTSRTINGKALSSNITLSASDVGALADSITINDLTTTAQQNALNSGATTTNIGQISTNTNDISDIQDLIPAQASDSNQLADKNFVNSSIATNTANFIGTFNSVAELEAYSGTLTNNDYAFVVGTDSEGNTIYDRYKYTDATNPPSWEFEYELNNSSFTAAQWDAINSGITNGDVSLIQSALQTGDNITELVNNAGYITGINSTDVTTALGYTPVNPSSLATVATSGDYDDLTNKPTIPTNYVTTDTDQDITGRKTFLGEKAIYFKQSASTNKLGFTLYNTGNTELGAFEYRPNTISTSALLNVNCSYSGSDYVGFRYWGTAVNIIAPKVATAGNYYIPVNITDGINTVTANNTGTVNISSLLPDLSNYVTSSTLTTTLADYVLSSSLATVATSGNYNDLSNKPTIPTVNDGTITINQGGTQKGTFTLNQSGNTTIDLDAGGGGGSIDYINGGNA